MVHLQKEISDVRATLEDRCYLAVTMGTPRGDTVIRLNAGDPTIVTDSNREPGFPFLERVGTPACPPLTRKRRLAHCLVSNHQEGVKNMTTKSCVMAVLVAIVALTSLSWAQSPTDLNDLEIAHVAYTADTIDIRYAHLALAISDNPQVRTFAETMIRDHTAVNDKALALVKKLNVQPQ